MPDSTRQASTVLTEMADTGRVSSIDAHLRPFFETWLDTFVYNGRLDPQLRHLAVLRIMWRTGQAFEWGNHYRFARNAGVSREQVIAIRTSTPEFIAGQLGVVVRAADEMVDSGSLSPATLESVRDSLASEQLVDELLFLLAGYRMFASVSRSKRIEHRTGHLRWPPDGVGPD